MHLSTHKLSFLFFSILILLAIPVIAPCPGDPCCPNCYTDEDVPWGSENTEEIGNALTTTVSSGGTAPAGIAPPNTPVTSGSQEVAVTGTVSVTGGKLDAEQANLDKGSFEDGKGFQGTDNGFTMDSAAVFEYDQVTATNAQAIHSTPTTMTIGHVDTLQVYELDISDANILYIDQNITSLGSAEKIEGQDIELNNVLTTQLGFEKTKIQSIKATSAKDQNTAIIKNSNVIYDQRDEINAKTSDTQTIQLNNGKITLKSGEVIVVNDSFASVQFDEKVYCVYLGKNSYYQDNFTIFNLKDPIFTLCFQELPKCQNCGIITEDKSIFNGTFNYLVNNSTIIENRGAIEWENDIEITKVTDATIYSSYFQIQMDEYIYNFHKKTPNTITKVNEISISDILHRYDSFTMYAKGTSEHADFMKHYEALLP